MTLTATPLLSAEPFELLARVFRAGGDALRLEILRALREDAYAVLELCRIFGVRQPALSHHLKVLAEAGLLARRREGTTIFYHRSPAATLDPAAQALLAAADTM
ncbi:MAG: ArsR/SmtB family transcription factor, partial [Gammaproteobacteria bacterium]